MCLRLVITLYTVWYKFNQERFSASGNHRGNDVAHTISKQPQSRTPVDKCDYPVLYHEEAISCVYFMSDVPENHSHPRGNQGTVLWLQKDHGCCTPHPPCTWSINHRISSGSENNRTVTIISMSLSTDHWGGGSKIHWILCFHFIFWFGFRRNLCWWGNILLAAGGCAFAVGQGMRRTISGRSLDGYGWGSWYWSLEKGHW